MIPQTPRISLEEAWERLHALPGAKKTEIIPFQSALGRVLSADIVADRAVPPFDRSAVDGYALRAADIATASKDTPITLQITEEIAAGATPTLRVQRGQAAKILTGAPIPKGADTIQKYEETDFISESVTCYAPLISRTNYVPAGEDIKSGDQLAAAGDVVSPPLQGLMASLDYLTVPVYKKPLVTVINTGSELTEPGEEMVPGKIRNSNRYSIGGYLEEAGFFVESGTIVEDAVEPLAKAIDMALAKSDMVLTTGGVSVGDYDMVRAAVDTIGAKQLFWKIRIKPGGSMLAAEKDGKLILGLSGNPGSAAIGLHMVALPFLRKLAGQRCIFPQKLRATLLSPIEKNSDSGRFVRGRLVFRDGTACFEPIENRGNGTISSLLGWDLLMYLPPKTPPQAAGASFDAYWIYSWASYQNHTTL